jgi:hypothetical protein
VVFFLYYRKVDLDMEERTYKVMGRSGALNIAFGVISIVAGTAAGILLIISGAKLLQNRSKIMF